MSVCNARMHFTKSAALTFPATRGFPKVDERWHRFDSGCRSETAGTAAAVRRLLRISDFLSFVISLILNAGPKEQKVTTIELSCLTTTNLYCNYIHKVYSQKTKQSKKKCFSDIPGVLWGRVRGSWRRE